MPDFAGASPTHAVPLGAALVLAPDEIRLLTEVGYLAAAQGDVPRARTIFTALRSWRPERAFPLIGLALAYMNAGRHAEAVRLLEDVSLQPPESLQLQVWRGLALWLDGNHHAGSRALQAAVDALDAVGDAADPETLSLAQALLSATMTGSDPHMPQVRHLGGATQP